VKDTFPQVSHVQPIGYGDPEMVRDLVLPHRVHKGGDVDVFVRTGSLPSTQVVSKGILGLSVELLPPETPILKVVSVQVKNGEMLTLDEDYTVSYGSTDLTEQSFSTDRTVRFYSRFSAKEKVILTFLKSDLESKEVIITTRNPSGISSVQSFLEDEENRVIAANLLARTFAPVFISLNISYRVTGFDSPVDEISLKVNLQNYVNSLAGEETVEVSKIVNILEETAGLKSVVLPLIVSSEIHKTDGTTVTSETQDKLVIPTEKDLGFSQKICQYILLSEDIVFTQVIDG
jgi:hypothetical protein